MKKFLLHFIFREVSVNVFTWCCLVRVLSQMMNKPYFRNPLCISFLSFLFSRLKNLNLCSVTSYKNYSRFQTIFHWIFLLNPFLKWEENSIPYLRCGCNYTLAKLCSGLSSISFFTITDLRIVPYKPFVTYHWKKILEECLAEFISEW